MELYREMEACFALIEENVSKKEMACFLDCPYEALSNYHFGLGTWIRNQLLCVDGTLYHAFVKGGIHQKDDMSGWIIKGFYVYMQEKQK